MSDFKCPGIPLNGGYAVKSRKLHDGGIIGHHVAVGTGLGNPQQLAVKRLRCLHGAETAAVNTAAAKRIAGILSNPAK